MRTINPRNYNSEDLDARLTDEVSPPALVSLLADADSWTVDAAVAPYCGCAHVFDGLSATAYEARYLGLMVAPAAVHARAAISRGYYTLIGTATTHDMWSSDGGAFGNDIIKVPWHMVASLNYPASPTFQFAQHSIAVSGGSIVDTPTTATDRQIELATAGAPYIESMYISLAAGFSVCITEQIADLETL